MMLGIFADSRFGSVASTDLANVFWSLFVVRLLGMQTLFVFDHDQTRCPGFALPRA